MAATSILSNPFVYRATVTSPKLQHSYYCNHIYEPIISLHLYIKTYLTKNYIIHLSKLYINNFCFKKLYNIWFIIIGVNNITVARVVTVTSRDTLWLTPVPGVDVVVRHTQTQSLSQCIVYTSATHRPSEQKKQPQCCHDTCNWPAWLILDNV